MNISSLQYAVLMTVTALVGPAFGQGNSATKKIDPSGVWRWTHDENGETVKDVLTLNFDGKQVSGKYKGRVEKTIEQAKLDNDKLTFQFDVEYEGQKIAIKFDGTLKEDSLEGKVLAETGSGTQEFPWSAKRTLEEDDVLGLRACCLEQPQDGQNLFEGGFRCPERQTQCIFETLFFLPGVSELSPLLLTHNRSSGKLELLNM